MKKKTVLLLIITILMCTTAHAVDDIKTLIKEYEFISTSKEFDYDVPETITEDETNYILQDIEYQIMNEETFYETQTEIFTQEISMEGVEKDDATIFEDIITIAEDGYSGTIL